MSKTKAERLVAESLAPSERELYEQRIRTLRRDLRVTAKESLRRKKELDTLLALGKPVVTNITSRGRGKTDTPATVILQASDWHVEEIVDPKSISGYPNRYNPEIAKKRADNFFRIGQRLTEIVSRELSVEVIMLPLLGDFLTNELHEDAAENNAMPPIEAAQYAQDLLASGIAFLAEQNPGRKIVCVCHSGNHGRVTKKVHHAKEHGHSLEYFMYSNLNKLFASLDNVTFNVAQGYHEWTTIYGRKVRTHHGHNIRYHGGVGGITIPVNKAIAQWDKARQANLDLFGHFHTLQDSPKWASNGSLIGYNAYAVSIKAEPEEPQQWFHVIDAKRGRTHRAPMFVDAPTEGVPL